MPSTERMNHYDKKFYADQQAGSYLSANEILPHVFKYFTPASVIDIGCGVGTWLHVIKKEYGINTILGVDGDYVSAKELQIDEQEFKSHDLTQYYAAQKKYDLAISVEVGEHLPAASADALVDTLTHAADVVLFSAALVNQGGTYHINEQYPEYWAEKFAAKGYKAIDCIRKEIWNNEQVEWWYRQNIILYAKESILPTLHPQLQAFAEKTDPAFLTRIHPNYLNALYSKYNTLRTFNGFIRNKLSPLKKILGK